MMRIGQTSGRSAVEATYRFNSSLDLLDNEQEPSSLEFFDDEQPSRFYDHSSLADHRRYAAQSSYVSVPNELQLHHLCARAAPPVDNSNEARQVSEESWEAVREWIRIHNTDEVRQAMEHIGESSVTALHIVCRNRPPADVVNTFLNITLQTLSRADINGWLPMHYACACGAHHEVIKALVDAFPDSKTARDSRARTPLHFALMNASQYPDQLVPPAIITIISSPSVAAHSDDIGMLPLHYACAYGASEEVLLILTGAYRDAISQRDNNNRTPLHFALTNADRPKSPGAVRHLLELDPCLANSNGGPPPLHVFTECAKGIRPNKNVQRCLEYLLRANPEPTVDFFTALQSLPEWLQERAVVLPSVQILLNYKISQRFPTMLLMGDFYFLVIIIVTYYINVSISLRKREDDTEENTIDVFNLIALYIGAGYFLFREMIGMISFISLKSFHIWLQDQANWLNFIFIFLVVFWTYQMQTGGLSHTVFRVGTAVTTPVLYLKVIGYVRNVVIDFAVFVGGALYVCRRLLVFLIGLMIILVCFAQMLVTVYRQSKWCEEFREDFPKDNICTINADKEIRPYCEYWSGFLNVYTMLLGQVDETSFQVDTEEDLDVQSVATFLFILFMFLVVILLANVLIAIVTDSYKVIQDRRAAIVFWTNRLGFVAEIDAIANGPWKKRIRKFFRANSKAESKGREDLFGKDFWRRLMDLFEYHVDADEKAAKSHALNLVRIVIALLIIPAWVCLGLLTVGWLWPPQLRELIFTSIVSSHASESEREDNLRNAQVMLLQMEVKELEEIMEKEHRVNHIAMIQMKSCISGRNIEIANETKNIKQMMITLFYQQDAL